jgi:NAD-dependent deacetylase
VANEPDPDAGALARFLERNAPVLAFTGAGVSTASGLPDFRSPGGLWERLDPMVDGHVDMLARDPARVWQCWAEPLVGASIAHNPAHAALARLEAGGFLSGVVTQNIDGLHHAAGSVAIEVHGHLRTARCMRCGAEEDMPPALARYTETRGAPECLVCGGTLRPQVVLFGEPLPGSAWELASALVERSRGCVAVGTSLQVYPAAGIAESFARRRRPLAIVSREATALWENADPRLLRSAEELLPAVASILLTEPPDSP